MYSFDQQISLFPASFTKENINAIDFSSQHIVAIATGNTVTLSYMKDFRLHQAFSFIVGEHPITALRFDKTNQFLIIGNARNSIYLYNYHTRNFLSKPHSRNSNLYIKQIELYENGFLVLYKTGQLTFYTLFEKKNAPTNLILNCCWETKYSEQMTNFALDPFRSDRIFFYSENSSYFQIYLTKEIHKPPKPTSGPMEITNERIQSAKFSIHLKDYLFFITENSIMLYNVDLQVIIPLSHDQRTASQLSDIIQFPTDHTKLLLVYKTGSLSLLHLQKPFNLFSLHELNHIEQNQTLLSYKLSPLRDDILVLNYDPLGIALFDVFTFRIISVIPLYLDKITSFDTDGTYYVFGTEKGYLISGNAFNINEKNVYKVSSIKSNGSQINNFASIGNSNFLSDNDHTNKKSITFVSLNQAKGTIYWAANDGSVGDVNMADKVVKRYHQHVIGSQRNKAKGNSNGALVIQRDPCVLGVFIDGKEQLFTSECRIIDFCFDDENSSSDSVSSSTSGSVMVLQENHVFTFFNYSKEKGVSPIVRKLSFEKILIPLCCAWCGKMFAFGAEDGYAYFINHSNKMNVSTKVFLNGFAVRKIGFCGQWIFALTSDNVLFGISGEKVTQCATHVAQFAMFNSYLLMVLSMQSSIYFLKLSDLKRLKHNKTMAIPSSNQFALDALFNNPVLNYNNELKNTEQNQESVNSEQSAETANSEQNQDAKKHEQDEMNDESGFNELNIQESHDTLADVKDVNFDDTSDEQIEDGKEPNFEEQSVDENSEEKNADENSEEKNADENSEEKNADENSEDQNVDGYSDEVHETESKDSEKPTEEKTEEKDQKALPTNPLYIPSIWSYKFKVSFNDRYLAYVSRTARVFWQFLLNKPSFRNMLLYAAGDSKEYSEALCELIQLGSIIETNPNYCYETFLYSNKTEESVNVFSKESPKSSSYLYHTILSTAALSFEEDGITDEQCARIKSAGISLITNDKIKEGCLLLKLAKLDNVAVEYLLQLKKFKKAMKFLCWSSTITKDEKENACFYIACKLLNETQPQYRKAMLFFLTAKEYLHALYCLYKLKKFDDAYVIKEYLLKNKLLNNINNSEKKQTSKLKRLRSDVNLVMLSNGKYSSHEKDNLFGMHLPPQKLFDAIDMMFASSLKQRRCDPANFGVALKPLKTSNAPKEKTK